MKALLIRFIFCHRGKINKIAHIIGLLILLYGLYVKSIGLFLCGIGLQELGHLYQYSRTRRKEDSPFHCSLPQLIFIGPLFILAVVYILFG